MQEEIVRVPKTGTAEVKPEWEAPKLEVIELREIETVADLEVAFTSSATSGDFQP
jgi:hypothetical protein